MSNITPLHKPFPGAKDMADYNQAILDMLAILDYKVRHAQESLQPTGAKALSADEFSKLVEVRLCIEMKRELHNLAAIRFKQGRK